MENLVVKEFNKNGVLVKKFYDKIPHPTAKKECFQLKHVKTVVIQQSKNGPITKEYPVK